MRAAFIILIALILTGCAGHHTPENDVPIPSVIFAEAAMPLQPILPAEEPIQPEPDIPPFNEYIISMEFEPETRIIRGIESVRYTNRSPYFLDELIFRAFLSHMDIHHVFWDNEELDFSLNGTILSIQLPRYLEPDETMQLRIQFEAYIPTGIGRIGANEQAIWAGAFLPVEAVLGSRGWHTESYYPIGSPFILDVANYIVEIITPIGYVVAGTGTKTEEYLDDKKVTSFTAPMTRNFAFAISPYFQTATRLTYSDREIRLYHYTPNLPIEHILDVAEESMTIFEQTIGAYPFPQISIIETDIFRPGESFSSVIFIDGNPLRLSSSLSGLRTGIGKQWFSVIIGNNQIDEAWLSGGLTLLVQDGLLDYPDELRSLIEWERGYLYNWQHLIYNEDSRRIISRISDYQNWTDYIRIQYRKARIMFYALYVELGSEVFFELLREYFRQYAFKIATAQDFMTLAEELHENDLQDFFNYWLNTTEIPELP